MPEDNAQLAAIDIDFPRLADDSSESCPVSIDEMLRYLACEAPGGESLSGNDLQFLRTAEVEHTRYWIWCFHEPDGGKAAYATVSLGRRATVVGYETDYYGLTPEQFILGDYHNVF